MATPIPNGFQISFKTGNKRNRSYCTTRFDKKRNEYSSLIQTLGNPRFGFVVLCFNDNHGETLAK